MRCEKNGSRSIALITTFTCSKSSKPARRRRGRNAQSPYGRVFNLSISVSKSVATVITFTITPVPQMSNKQKRGAVGLDIGGTKIAAGIMLWPSGEILHRVLIPTKPTRGGEAVLRD